MTETVPSLVSTIIPAYNRPEMLREAVASVLAQTYRPIEVIVVDDGSTDETPRVGEELARRYPEEVRFIRKANSGPGPTREAGRLAARGEFIQYLDSDDLLLPNKFTTEVNGLRQRPDCGIAYGYMRRQTADGAIDEKPYKWTGRTIEAIYPSLLVDRWWCTHTPLFRRQITDAIGPWSDLRFSQDMEYDARAGSLQPRLLHCQEFTHVIRQHTGARQTSPADLFTPARSLNDKHLYDVIYQGALTCGVPAGTREMLHFSRVMFMLARSLAAVDHVTEAKECFTIAKAAAGESRSRGWDFRAYQGLSRCFGWRVTGRLARLTDRFRRHAGPESIPWTWAEM